MSITAVTGPAGSVGPTDYATLTGTQATQLATAADDGDSSDGTQAITPGNWPFSLSYTVLKTGLVEVYYDLLSLSFHANDVGKVIAVAMKDNAGKEKESCAFKVGTSTQNPLVSSVMKKGETLNISVSCDQAVVGTYTMPYRIRRSV